MARASYITYIILQSCITTHVRHSMLPWASVVSALLDVLVDVAKFNQQPLEVALGMHEKGAKTLSFHPGER